MIAQRRTFEAAQHGKESEERARLNRDALTSEYMPSHRYIVKEPALMSDGRQNPTQQFFNHTFRTKGEAEAFITTKQGQAFTKRRLEA